MKKLMQFAITFVVMYITFYSIITSKDMLYHLGDGVILLGSAIAVFSMVFIDKVLFKKST